MEQPRSNQVQKIGVKNFIAILSLGITGQIAWVMENSNFNTFVYDEITKDPAPVAWMVAISAITATLTTIFMGIKSDRTIHKWGKRKPYLFYGYLFWGIITILFPMVAWIKLVGVAVVMVIIVDAVMTFFGSTANDAAFNAWITDISHSSNRNRVQTLNSLSGFIAIAITYGIAGVIIDNFGYTVFFFIFGALISIIGLLSYWMVDSVSNPSSREEYPESQPIWKEVGHLISPKLLKENRILFLLFINMAMTGIATQVYLPYIFQYLEHYMGFTKTEYSGYIIMFMPLLVVMVVLIGWVSHKFNRKKTILFGTVAGGLVTIILGLVSDNIRQDHDNLAVWAIVLYVISQIPTMAASIAHGGWLLDSYPKGDVGKFQGIRMVFMVALPMIIGPPIGALIIRKYGIPIEDGFIPTPEMFIVGGVLAMLAIIPILFIPKDAGKIELERTL